MIEGFITGNVAPYQKTVAEIFQKLEEQGFPPEAFGFPFRTLEHTDLPLAVSSVMKTLIQQREDLLKEVLELRPVQTKLDAMTKDRDDWKREHELFKNAWLRALDNKVFNKHHLIDALVITTIKMRKAFEELEKLKRDHNLAAEIAEYGPFIPRTQR